MLRSTRSEAFEFGWSWILLHQLGWHCAVGLSDRGLLRFRADHNGWLETAVTIAAVTHT